MLKYLITYLGSGLAFAALDAIYLTVAGQKVVLSGGAGSSQGRLPEQGSQYYIQGQETYTWSGSNRTMTWTSTGILDGYWLS